MFGVISRALRRGRRTPWGLPKTLASDESSPKYDCEIVSHEAIQ